MRNKPFRLFALFMFSAMTCLLFFLVFSELKHPTTDVYSVLDGQVELGAYYRIPLTLPETSISDEEVLTYANQYANGMDLDEYAASIGYASSEEYISAVRDALTENQELSAKLETRDLALDTVVANSNFRSVSSKREDSYFASAIATYHDYMEFYNTDDINDIYELYQTSEDEIRQDCKQQLRRDMITLILSKVEKIEVTDADFDAAVTELSETEYLSEESVRSTYDEGYIRFYALEMKVADFIIDHAVIS